MKMRKTLYLLLALALVLSCAKAGQGSDPEVKGCIRLTAGNPGLTLTKTTNTGLTPYWSVGDRIGVCQLSDASNVAFTTDITAPAATASFSGPEGQSGSCFAYYPYKESSRSGSVVSLPISATQYPGESSFDGNSDILVSNPFDISNGGVISFHRLTAVAKIVLRDNTTGHVLTGLEVERVRFSVADVAIAGTVGVDGSNGTLGTITSGATNAVEAIHSEGNRYSVDGTSGTYLNLYPASMAASTAVTIEAWLGNMYVVKNTVIPSGGLKLQSGYVSTLLVDIADSHVTCHVPPITLNADVTPTPVPDGTETVGSLTEFKGIGMASYASKAGTVVVIRDGTYADFQAYVNSYGTADNPLVIRAETMGGVTFTGNSFLCLNQPYVQVFGIRFASLGTTLPDGRVEHLLLNSGAHHCLISQCEFDYTTFAGTASDNICDIRICSTDDKVEFCSFLDKKCMGPQIAIQPNDSHPEDLRTSVVYCYFTRPTVINDAANGQESILLGLSKWSQRDLNCFIARNYFYKSDGEHSEVLSVKGCSNTVEENYFLDCYGTLSLRHGKSNIVQRNFQVCSDKTAIPMCNGVSVYDADNVVRNNYFYNIPDKVSGFAPVSLMTGSCAPERSETDPTVLKSFWQVKSAVVKDNVMRGCNTGIAVNIGSYWGRDYHPINCSFEGNIVYDSREPVYYTLRDGDTMTADGHTWTGNLFSVTVNGIHNNAWGLVKSNIACVFPDTEYNAAMARICGQAGVTW